MYMHFLRKRISSDNQDYWSLLLHLCPQYELQGTCACYSEIRSRKKFHAHLAQKYAVHAFPYSLRVPEKAYYARDSKLLCVSMLSMRACACMHVSGVYKGSASSAR